MILAIFSDNAFPRCCPILAQSGRRDHPDGRSGAYVPRLRDYCMPLLRSPCQPDGTPGEGCLTEVWPGASGHTRWRNEMVRRATIITVGGDSACRRPLPLRRGARASGAVPLSEGPVA